MLEPAPVGKSNVTRSPALTVTLLSDVLDDDASWNQVSAPLSCAVILGPVGVTVGVTVGVAVTVGVGVGVTVPVTTISPVMAVPWASQKNVYVPDALNLHSPAHP